MGNSDFLFARPGFIEGMARSIDLFGALQDYNYLKTSEKDDETAISNDFIAIAKDGINENTK